MFTCLASRAIHLEMAYGGLDTAAGLFWELSVECKIEDKCQKKWFQTMVLILWMQSRVAETDKQDMHAKKID